MLNIRIAGIDSSNGNLILKGGGRNAVGYKGDKVSWTIDNDAKNVKSIKGIEMKADSPDIFKGKNGEKPGKENDKKWKAVIADDAKDGDVYEYSILWVDDSGTDHTDDPKISIQPDKNLLGIISIVVLSLGLLYLVYWRMQKIKKRKTQQRP